MFQGYWQTSIGLELKGKMLGLDRSWKNWNTNGYNRTSHLVCKFQLGVKT